MFSPSVDFSTRSHFLTDILINALYSNVSFNCIAYVCSLDFIITGLLCVDFLYVSCVLQLVTKIVPRVLHVA